MTEPYPFADQIGVDAIGDGNGGRRGSGLETGSDELVLESRAITASMPGRDRKMQGIHEVST